MRKCLACNARFESSTPKCHACGASPAFIDRFEAYAPEFARGEGFEAQNFVELANLEAQNFWFRARNRLILWALEKYSPNFRSFLELGCGTGFVLSGVSSKFPDRMLAGSEISIDGLPFASRRAPSAWLMQMDARRVPFVDEFDVVGAFDVVEHIEEDEIVFSQIHQALKPGGIAIITVPQHAWLWSATDEYACHKRRYSAVELERKMRANGFDIMRSSSFVTLLLPAMMVSRLTKRALPGASDPLADLRLAPALNLFFETILNLERRWISAGLNFPCGGSRLVVAAKRSVS